MTKELKQEINAAYFSWLKERVHAHLCEFKHYNYVLRQLYDTKAYCLVKGDDDWLENAVYNRILFNAAYPNYSAEEILEAIGPQCNLFELGYKLADYTNSQIIREELYWDGTHEVFWEFIENIGLDSYTDRRMGTIPNAVKHVTIIIESLNERRYTAEGKGNWFMLANPRDGIDMRRIPLLKQSWAYVNEGQGHRWLLN